MSPYFCSCFCGYEVAVISTMPWAVSFLDRMKWFRVIVDKDKLGIQGSNDTTHLLTGGFRSKGQVVKVVYLVMQGYCSWSLVNVNCRLLLLLLL